MFARYCIVLIVFVLLSCTNEFFPEEFFDYQVERLLSGGSTKEWDEIIASENCSDSIRLVIELISSTVDDSVTISQVVRGNNCNPDTSLIGIADASSFSDAIRFTDSLNFANGNFWIIQSITATSLTILNGSETVNYSSD